MLLLDLLPKSIEEDMSAFSVFILNILVPIDILFYDPIRMTKICKFCGKEYSPVTGENDFCSFECTYGMTKQ